MKYIFLSAVLLLFVIPTFGQQKFNHDYRVIYELAFIPDSTNLTDVKKEYLELLYSDSISIFRSVSSGENDSIAYSIKEDVAKVNSQGGTIQYPITKRTDIRYRILIRNETIEYLEPFGPVQKYYYYTEKKEDSNQWEILKETKQIGNFTCQKATQSYGGREWTAWFTAEIPLSYGPYKFGGLPGLILELEDKSGSWKFSFIKLTKKGSSYVLFANDKYEQVDKNKFFDIKIDFLKNGFEKSLATGTSYPNLEIQTRAKKSFLKKSKANNNWIELRP